MKGVIGAVVKVLTRGMRASGNPLHFRSGRAGAAATVMLIAVQTAACSLALSSRVAPDPDDEPAAAKRLTQVAAGEIRALSHPGWMPLPETAGAGIYFLEPYDPKRIPVLFIHGIGGTPRDFRGMIDSLDPQRFQAWVFHYPTNLRMHVVVGILHDAIVELRRKHGFGAVFVTAHSAGGLVARGYVQSVLKDGDHEYVKLLVTFSSPFEGHRWAAVGTRYALNPVPSWSDLSPGSEYLVSLREPLLRSGHRVPHYVFFAFQRAPSLVMTESSDGVIAMSSQLPLWVQDQAERYWGYDVEHTAILSNGGALDRYQRLLRSEAGRLARSAP